MQRVERNTFYHIPDRETGDVEHCETGIDALDGAERGERTAAAARQPAVVAFGLLHKPEITPPSISNQSHYANPGRHVPDRS